MAYFDQIGKINFENQNIDNFFFSYRIPESYYKAGIYQPYFVRDGERPERIAEKMYGTDKLWWIILVYNKIVNPWEEWPMDNQEIEIKTELESRRIYGDNYNMSQFTEIFDALSLENESKRSIRLPLATSLMKILQDVDGFFRQQRLQ
jgi:hypothetical protein